MNARNPWSLPNISVAQLIVHCGLSYQQIGDTPPRVLYNLLQYIRQAGPYRRKAKPSILDKPMTPAELRSFMEGQRKLR